MLSSPKPNALSLSIGKNNSTTTIRELQKFLQFQLGIRDNKSGSSLNGDRALLEAELVTEIITVSERQILSVPQMPYCVMGIYSWRSEMLWIIDLENLLGYPNSVTQATPEVGFGPSNFMVMVVKTRGESLGLVVPNVSDIIQIDRQLLNPASLELFSKDIQPFLQGYFTDSNNEILMLLNAEKILQGF